MDHIIINTGKMPIARRETKAQSSPFPTHIVLLYVIFNEKFFIFGRDDGRVGTISGKREVNMGILEQCKVTCRRELSEEIGVHNINPRFIYSTPHHFCAISRKGKFLVGKSFYTILDTSSFKFSDIRLNHEITGFRLLTIAEAVEIIKTNGYPEQLEGLKVVARIIEK